jgi:hypothetical protein
MYYFSYCTKCIYRSQSLQIGKGAECFFIITPRTMTLDTIISVGKKIMRKVVLAHDNETFQPNLISTLTA